MSRKLKEKSKLNLERKTRRLVVRPMTAKDYKAWAEFYSSMGSERNQWDLSNIPHDKLRKSDFQKVLKWQREKRASDDYYDMGVFLKGTDKLIGLVALMDVLRGASYSSYIGYFLHQNFWGKGYGKEAVKALIEIAFKEVGLHRIEAGVEPNNRRSIMLARSLGLRKEGLKKRCVFLGGKWRDLVMYSATTEDFGIKWQGQTKRRPR